MKLYSFHFTANDFLLQDVNSSCIPFIIYYTKNICCCGAVISKNLRSMNILTHTFNCKWKLQKVHCKFITENAEMLKKEEMHNHCVYVILEKRRHISNDQ